MKKSILVLIVLFVAFSVFAEEYWGRVQVYFDQENLCIEYVINDEIGNNYSHFTKGGNEHYLWKEVSGGIIMWLNDKDYPCQVLEERGVIQAKIPRKEILIGEETVLHFSWIVNGEYYSLINHSPFAAPGNEVNPDYHFECKVTGEGKIIPHADY